MAEFKEKGDIKLDGDINGRKGNLQMASFIDNTHPFWLRETERIQKRDSANANKEITHFDDEILHVQCSQYHSFQQTRSLEMLGRSHLLHS
jgi:hypothetical protein